MTFSMRSWALLASLSLTVTLFGCGGGEETVPPTDTDVVETPDTSDMAPSDGMSDEMTGPADLAAPAEPTPPADADLTPELAPAELDAPEPTPPAEATPAPEPKATTDDEKSADEPKADSGADDAGADEPKAEEKKDGE